jgi:hypothetical protein
MIKPTLLVAMLALVVLLAATPALTQTTPDIDASPKQETNAVESSEDAAMEPSAVPATEPTTVPAGLTVGFSSGPELRS